MESVRIPIQAQQMEYKALLTRKFATHLHSINLHLRKT